MRPNPVDEVFAAIDTAISRLARVDVDRLAHAELLTAVRTQNRLVNRAQAQRTRLISAIRSRGAVVDAQSQSESESQSIAVWMRAELHLGNTVAQLRAATVTEVLPAVAEAYARGDLSLEHVEAIASIARDFRPAALTRADRRIAAEAARLTPDALRRAASRIRAYS
jgi:hypothetical protein